MKYLQAKGAVLGQVKALVVKAAPPMAMPPIARRYVLCMLEYISVNGIDISELRTVPFHISLRESTALYIAPASHITSRQGSN